jgi:ferredoxin-type protein NapF
MPGALPDRPARTRRRRLPAGQFPRGECLFCGHCAQSCPTGALHDIDSSPWRLKAAIDARCLTRQGVTCQVCGDHCPTHALRFPPQAGAAAVPLLDLSACRGCGACVAVCPAQAITMTELP